jgi:hypothetical protein
MSAGRLPLRPGLMAGDRVALIVAVDDYDHGALTRLSAPAADAEALAAVLGDPDLGGFSVATLVNATASNTVERIEEFLGDRRSDDLALLHFSCHGLKDDQGELYLAARNTNPERLASTAVDAALVTRLMRRSRAQRIVLLLDCCYGGAFERGAVARAGGSVGVGEHFHQESLAGGRGRVVITASNAMEYAFEGRELSDGQRSSPAVFTSAVVDGIRSGEADRDGDGQIGIGELYDFVHDRVRGSSPQTPCKWEYGSQGELVVARAPRRRVRRGRLSVELVELIEHPYPAVRRSAVEELLRLAQGEDLPSAVAARAALLALVDDDSRAVSTAAATAVSVCELRLSEDVVAFGQLERGLPAPTLTVELLGPPIVVTAEPVEVPAGVTAKVRGRTVELRADTDAERTLEGSLVMSSAAGEARLRTTGSVEIRRGAAPLREVEPAHGPEVAASVRRRRRLPEPAPSAAASAPPSTVPDEPVQSALPDRAGAADRPFHGPDRVHLAVLAVLVGGLAVVAGTFIAADLGGRAGRIGNGLGLAFACLAATLLPRPRSAEGQAACRAGCWAAASLAAVFLLRWLFSAFDDDPSSLPGQLLWHVVLAAALLAVTAAGSWTARRPAWTQRLQVLQVSTALALAVTVLANAEYTAEAGVPASIAAVLSAVGLRHPAPQSGAEPDSVVAGGDARRRPLNRISAGVLVISVVFLLVLLLRQDQDTIWYYGEASGLWLGWTAEYGLGMAAACLSAALLRPPGRVGASFLRAAQLVSAAVAVVFVFRLVFLQPDDDVPVVALLAAVLLGAFAAALGRYRAWSSAQVTIALRTASVLCAAALVAAGLHRALGYFWFPQTTVAATAATLLGAVGLLRLGAGPAADDAADGSAG